MRAAMGRWTMVINAKDEFDRLLESSQLRSKIFRRHSSSETRSISAMSFCLRHTLRIASPVRLNVARSVVSLPAVTVRAYSTPTNSQDDHIDESLIPTRIDRSYETPDVTRARLLYQSRKRGILETDLLLSTFADKFLPSMSPEELQEYDTVRSRSQSQS